MQDWLQSSKVSVGSQKYKDEEYESDTGAKQIIFNLFHAISMDEGKAKSKEP
tara:strand:+ start:268 stop:423 length:156 start_codon:yes stop_codon:yes gene_type:complete